MEKYGYKFELSEQVKSLLDNYDDELYAPNKDCIYNALQLTPLKSVKVVILGQDPYPVKGDACGLSFSVNRDNKLPKSLINIFKELENDLAIERKSGDLSDWAQQGVLLLNTIMTVTIGDANSHRKLGWEEATNEIIKQVSDQGNIIFILLGRQAQEYKKMIDVDNNFIIETSHPSPLGAYRGFNGSKIFSKTNEILISTNRGPIKW